MIRYGTCLTLVLLAVFLASTSADNPVLCKLSDIVGTWELTFDAEPIRKDPYNPRMSCGRGQPTQIVNFGPEENAQDKFLANVQGRDGDSGEAANTYTRTFQFVKGINFYEVVDGERDTTNVGTWTMVLHEGMQAFIGDTVLDTFWRYNLVDENKQSYESICYETIVGWYHTVDTNNPEDELWGCFYGKKLDVSEEAKDPDNHSRFEGGNPVRKADPNKEDSTCQKNVGENAAKGKFDWTPKEGVGRALSKNYVAFSPNADNQNSDRDALDPSENTGQLSQLGQYLDLVGRDPDLISDCELPDNLNWADVNGITFFPKIRNQE